MKAQVQFHIAVYLKVLTEVYKYFCLWTKILILIYKYVIWNRYHVIRLRYSVPVMRQAGVYVTPLLRKEEVRKHEMDLLRDSHLDCYCCHYYSINKSKLSLLNYYFHSC
jgi:hypothetical protein